MARSGRDERGTGGAAVPFLDNEKLVSLPLAPLVLGSCRDLFMPSVRADGLAGIGGGACSWAAFRAGSAGCEDLLGGRAGRAGGGVTSTVLIEAVLFAVLDAVLALSTSRCSGKAFDLSISRYRFSTSSFVRFGGSGGRELASYAGALILFPASMEGVLE